jgi:hypothetical protein
MALKKRSPSSRESSTSNVGALPGKLLSGWPSFLEFLSSSVWEDGTKRELGKVSIRVESGRWRMQLNDPNTGEVAWADGDTPEDVLSLVDDALANDKINWQVDRYAQPKKKK